jgi:hypothetical protein
LKERINLGLGDSKRTIMVYLKRTYTLENYKYGMVENIDYNIPSVFGTVKELKENRRRI